MTFITVAQSELMRGKRMQTHLCVITLLYFCQGICQACLQLTPLLLLQRYPQMSPAWQAMLRLPLSAFVLKCLWAPVVDRLYVPCGKGTHPATCAAAPASSFWQRHRRACHRRVQWVVAFQLLLLVLVVRVARQAGLDDVFAADTFTASTALLSTVLLVLLAVAFASATQDVAIDAWAIEGLPVTKASLAGTMQLVGVTGGILSTNAYVQFQSCYPSVFSVTNFFCLLALLLAVSVPLAVYLALLEELAPMDASARRKGASASPAPSPPPPPRVKENSPDATMPMPTATTAHAPRGVGLIPSLRMLFTTRGTRDTIVLHMTRGWAIGGELLMGSRLVSLGLMSATMWSRYSVYGTVLQLLLGSLTANRVLTQVPAARVCRLVCAAGAGVTALSTIAFIMLASPSARDWYGPLFVLPFTLILSALGAYTYVASMVLAGSVAHRFPHDSGTVLTLLAAVSNLGHTLPHTCCMFLASGVVAMTTSFFGRDTRYGVQRNVTPHHTTSASTELPPAPLWMLKLDVLVCSVLFLTIGVWMFFRFVTPASLALERDEQAHTIRSAVDDGDRDGPTAALLVSLTELTCADQ